MAGAAEVVNGFSQYLHILMSLYQFYIHHSGEMEGTEHRHPLWQATLLCSHSYSQGRPSPEQPRDAEGVGSPSHLATLPNTSPDSSAWHCMHAGYALGWHDQVVAVTATGDVNTAAKMLQSLRSNTVKPLKSQERVEDCDSV